MVTAKDIMTRSVITLSPAMEIVAAAKILLDNHINGAPVVDEKNTIVGILTRDDLITQQKKLPLPSYFVVLDALIPIRSTRQVEKELDKIAATNVEHAMTHNPVMVTPETPIEEVASIMVDRKIHTIPVRNEAGGLLGIIGKEDVLKTIIPGPGTAVP